MAVNPNKLRSLYRALLRELPPRPILGAPRSPLHKSLHDTFSSHQQQLQSRPELTVAQAEQFVQYLKAQRTYTTLVERYNPGMGMDEEERVRLTARRVGMDLPVEYESGEGEK
ncbi:ATP synthase assembly factor FMC1, mitochondrial [Podospora aff. communis PSN243]|uniref:ATP synthase assembly factor FMC1, mitochondrial n=1 Tax=Podospora aff. communis PSN243 TaxID=3040156 RepID=A0AAV9GBY7_9PEZI|nr:ATP synthase assembly factor FMC1, mitochondrial [Podospora aff. communis PSN243]